MEQRLTQALSIAVEALLSTSSHEDPAARHALYERTIKELRIVVGPEHRFTTMRTFCCWCGVFLGEKEGNGATGDSHGACPRCFAERVNL